MPKRDEITIRPRVLLVSDDDTYSATLKRQLAGIHVLSVPESSVWVAIRAGLDVTRGVDAVLLDRGLTGRLQMRLYETLRPAEAPARVPVVFMRSKLTAASAGFDHELDVYQPEDATLDQAGRLVQHVLTLAGASGVAGTAVVPGLPNVPPGVAARLAAPVAGARRTSPVALGPGAVQRVGLWGVAVALIGFTFWPLLGSGPVRDAVFGPLKAFSSDNAKLANSESKARAAR
jgi:hypothetical protein